MTLLELLGQNGIRLRRIGKTYRARCPFHNGKTATSLSIDPQKGLYFCHGCGKTGDAIQWLRDYRGLSFIEACVELGIDRPGQHGGPRPERVEPLTRITKEPPAAWQQKAGAFLEWGQATLKTNRAAMRWLQKRGLKSETIEAAPLGWNPRDRYEERTSWGLEPEKDERGKVKKLWLPAGLVIPLVLNSVVMRLRIRRPEGKPRYVIVSGSDMRPMIFHRGQNTLTVLESELDGILVNQEARDMAGVVALGTATAKLDQELSELLGRASLILVSLDFDEAGARPSWGYWLSTYPQARRWPTPYGKDPSEAIQMGLNIRAWVEAGLSLVKDLLRASRVIERPPNLSLKNGFRNMTKRFLNDWQS